MFSQEMIPSSQSHHCHQCRSSIITEAFTPQLFCNSTSWIQLSTPASLQKIHQRTPYRITLLYSSREHVSYDRSFWVLHYPNDQAVGVGREWGPAPRRTHSLVLVHRNSKSSPWDRVRAQNGNCYDFSNVLFFFPNYKS